MENIKFKLDEETIEIVLEKKKIKRLYLKVKKDGTILISAPVNASMDYIMDFLDSRKKWLKDKLQHVSGIRDKNRKVYFLGEEIDHTYTYSVEYSILFRDKILMLTGPQWNDEIFEHMKTAWYKQQARRILPEIAREVVMKYNFPQDVVFNVRKMKSRLGTCYSNRRMINLNSELIKMEIPVIEFIILHELCHLKQPNHGKRFYNLLTMLMPDWKKRKKRIF